MLTPEIAARLQRFDEDLIAFPPFLFAKEAIEENLQLYNESGIARHMLVLGDAGTGKSSLCEWLVSAHPRVALPERDHIPVLVIRIPPLVNLGGVTDAFLNALGTFWAVRGTVTTKTARIVTLCRECGVQLILLDESQHLKDRGDAKSKYLVADWLKHLIDALGVPIVMLGLPRLEELLEGNEQLRRRFSRRISLALGQGNGGSIETECIQLFTSLASLIELPVRAEPYDIVEFGYRLRYATDGRVAYVKKLLFVALHRALTDGSEAIDVALLERVFTEEIWREGIGPLNPFHSSFAGRALDRRGEPFEAARTGRYR